MLAEVLVINTELQFKHANMLFCIIIVCLWQLEMNCSTMGVGGWLLTTMIELSYSNDSLGVYTQNVCNSAKNKQVLINIMIVANQV